MDYKNEAEQRWKNIQENYLDDIDTCIKLLEMLKRNYETPGAWNSVNSDKVKRTRITIHEILNEW